MLTVDIKSDNSQKDAKSINSDKDNAPVIFLRFQNRIDVIIDMIIAALVKAVNNNISTVIFVSVLRLHNKLKKF
jgi:hypothetical protein